MLNNLKVFFISYNFNVNNFKLFTSLYRGGKGKIYLELNVFLIVYVIILIFNELFIFHFVCF